LIPKLAAFWQAMHTINPAAVGVAAVTIGLILGLRRYRPNWPGFLIAIAITAVLTALFQLPVETIGSRFGGMPSSLPTPHLPDLSWDRVQRVLPDAFAIAILGGIESLLSAVVADAMSGQRHRSNCELVAQGIANVASPLFSGICATGTIARTATNVRSGAVGPVSGMMHSVFLLLFILVAAPLASYVPLAALAGLLATVAWNMAERHEFAAILTRSRGEAAVLLATFLLTIFRDLTEGIAVGVVLGSLLFMHRMANLTAVEVGLPLVGEDEADRLGERPAYTVDERANPEVMVLRLAGPLFFGASSTIAMALERIGQFPRTVILDLSSVPLADASAAASLKSFVQLAARHGAGTYVAGATPQVRHVLVREGLKPPLVRYAASVTHARTAIHP